MKPLSPVPCTPATIGEVVAACLLVDGEPPLSEHKLFVVEAVAEGAAACWEAAGAPAVATVAAAHRHPNGAVHWAVEVAVAPSARHLEASALRLAAGAVPTGASHTLWAWRPEQQREAAAVGYRTFRRLLRMEAPLPLQEPGPVAGFRLRAFRPGEDETAVAEVNNRAFAGHRENDAMTADSIRAKEQRAWFDPDGLLVAVDGNGSMAGFCWTKLEGAAGEIYVVAVDPTHHGRGLGRWLVLAGLDRLHRHGRATTARLWTDADNPAVDRLYRPLGFETTLVNEEMEPEPGLRPGGQGR